MSQTRAKSRSRQVSAGADARPLPPQPATPLHETILTPRRVAVILGCLVALGLLLRVQHLDDIARRTPDEYTYTQYASQVAEHGPGIFPRLVANYNGDPQLQIYPPPTRVGHLVLLAGIMKLTGTTDERAGMWLSTLASMLSLGLLAWIGYRFMPPLAAIYSLLFLATSVPQLVDARRAWQDSVVGFVGLAMLWLACEIAADSARWWPYAALAAIGSYSVLMKELMVFVYAACVLYVMLVLLRERAWRTMGAFVAAGLAGAGLSLLCLVKSAGGWDQLMLLWQHLNAAVRNNPYVNYQNGPWYRWVWGFWILSPVNLVLALGASVLAVMPQVSRWLGAIEASRLRLLAGLTVLLATLMKVLPNTQNFRYLAPVDGAMYALGGMGLWAVWLWAEARWSVTTRQALGALGAILIVGSAITGYMRFEQVFVTAQVPDLSIKMVVDSR